MLEWKPRLVFLLVLVMVVALALELGGLGIGHILNHQWDGGSNHQW